MEGPVVCGLITQVESDLGFRIVRRGFGVETGSLERDGALGQPIVLHHFLDEDLFGDGLGPVFRLQVNEIFDHLKEEGFL